MKLEEISSDGDSEVTNPYADLDSGPGSAHGSDLNSKAADCESKAPEKDMQTKVDSQMDTHEQQRDGNGAEEACETEICAQTDLWRQVELHKQEQNQEQAGAHDSEVAVEADLSKQKAWELICDQANVQNVSESMVASTGGTVPDKPGSATTDRERATVGRDVQAEALENVETQTQQQIYGQEEVQTCEQIHEHTNSHDPPEPMEVADAHITSGYSGVPWIRRQLKADRRYNAEIRRENRDYQDRYVLIESCIAAHQQTDEVRRAKMQRLRYAKMARKHGADVPQLPYCPIRQDPEYRRAVETAKKQQVIPGWVVETEIWMRRQVNWAARISQGDACEGLLFQERMNAEAGTEARWEMREGSQISSTDTLAAYEDSEVEEEPIEKESITQEQLEKIRRRRRAARKLVTSALKSKRSTAGHQFDEDETLRQAGVQLPTSEDQRSTTEESSSMRSPLSHREMAKTDEYVIAEHATRHDSVSSAQSSLQSSVFEEQLAGSIGDSSVLSSVAETLQSASDEQQSAPEKQSFQLEQREEGMRTRTSQMPSNAFLENSLMSGDSLSSAETINTDETVNWFEETDAGPMQRPPTPKPRKLSKRAYEVDVEVKGDETNHESPTKRGRMNLEAIEMMSARGQTWVQDQDAERK